MPNDCTFFELIAQRGHAIPEFFSFNPTKEISCKKEGRRPSHFINLEILAKLPAKNPLRCKTVKGGPPIGTGAFQVYSDCANLTYTLGAKIRGGASEVATQMETLRNVLTDMKTSAEVMGILSTGPIMY